MIERYSETPEELLKLRWPNIKATDLQFQLYVEPIVEDVRRRGDEAVKEYTQKFDNIEINELRVQPEEIQDAYNAVTERQVEAPFWDEPSAPGLKTPSFNAPRRGRAAGFKSFPRCRIASTRDSSSNRFSSLSGT